MKKYIVIGKLNKTWYEITDPMNNYEDALGHASMQNDLVPEMQAKAVEYYPGKFRILPDHDTPNVSKRKSSIEELLGGVNFDEPAVKEYRNGFENKQNIPPKIKADEPRHADVKASDLVEKYRIESEYQKHIARTSQRASKPRKGVQVYGEHIASTTATPSEWQGTRYADKLDPMGGTPLVYVAPHERGQSGSGIAQLALMLVLFLTVMSALFNG